jgi:hypothetical protein
VTIRETADASHSLNAPKLGLEYEKKCKKKSNAYTMWLTCHR